VRSAGDGAMSGRRQLTCTGEDVSCGTAPARASPSSSGKIAVCDDVRVTDEVLADQVDYYLGWECAIRRDGSDWVYGEARLAR